MWHDATLVKACYILFHFPLSVPSILSLLLFFPPKSIHANMLLLQVEQLCCYCLEIQGIFYLLFSNHKPEVPLAHFSCPVWKGSSTKSALSSCPLPSIKVYIFCCANTDFAVTFSLFHLCQWLFREVVSSLLLIPVMFGTRLQIIIKWKDAKGLCTIVIRLKWTGTVSWMNHKLLMHVCKEVALSKTPSI